VLAAELNKDLATDSSNRQYTLIFAKALSEQYSNNAQALNTAGIFFEEQYLYSKADWSYSKSIELLPNTFDAWLGAIRCHQRLFGPAKTLPLIDSALEYFPNTASLYTLAAQNANQLKQFNAAIDYCNAGTSFAIISSDIQNLSYNKAKAEFYKNDYKAALQSLSFAANDDKAEGRYLDLLGDIYYQLNQKDQALITWKKALENGANNAKLYKKISDGKYYE
jgi:tetratricopeptide (TPR) repeat protein